AAAVAPPPLGARGEARRRRRRLARAADAVRAAPLLDRVAGAPQLAGAGALPAGAAGGGQAALHLPEVPDDARRHRPVGARGLPAPRARRRGDAGAARPLQARAAGRGDAVRPLPAAHQPRRAAAAPERAARRDVARRAAPVPAVRGRALRAAPPRAVRRARRHHRPVAGVGAREGDVPGGARDGRDLCAQLVAVARPAAAAAHAGAAPATEVDELMGDPVRIAVLGLPEAEIVAACDLDAARLERIGRRYPALALTRSYDELLERDDVEAIAVATSVSTHHRLALAALEAGKHAFVEKPLAASSAEAEQLLETASELGLTLMPGHTFLYSPPVNLVKRLIDAGELGDIYFVSTSRVNLGLHQSDASVVWDLGPHDFSILRYWLGESPVEVAATARACIVPGTPDVAFVSIRHAGGTVGHVELSWLAPSKLRRTAVVGSQKMVVYDDTSSEPVRVFDSGVNLPDPGSFGEYGLTYRTGDIVSPRVDVKEPLALELQDFCRAVREVCDPRSSAQLGLDVVRTLEAVDRSLERGGRPAAPLGVEAAG